MIKKLPSLQVICAAILMVHLPAVVVGQTTALSVQALSAGLRPMGISTLGPTTSPSQILVVVANSGENSVSVLEITPSRFYPDFSVLASSTQISGVPSPYGVTGCGVGVFVATSPADNSISFVNAREGTVKATVTVGSQPYSAACFGSNVFVSNYGDSTVSVVDRNSFAVTRTIPNVPGSRGLRGVAVAVDTRDIQTLWVAGTNADVVTIVNPTTGNIVASIPVRSPTFLKYSRIVDGFTGGFVRVGSSLARIIHERAREGFL